MHWMFVCGVPGASLAGARRAPGAEIRALRALSVCSDRLSAIREQRELDVLTQKGPLRCETGRNLLDDMTRIIGAPMRRTASDSPQREDTDRPRPLEI